MATIKFPQTVRVPTLSASWVTRVLLVIGLVILAWTAFYTVPAESEGVVLRFGRFSRTVPSAAPSMSSRPSLDRAGWQSPACTCEKICFFSLKSQALTNRSPSDAHRRPA